jgi:serine phosphatase RsbU (regulator of sigma subunit)
MKILLVEDNPDDLFLARRELAQMGHEVVCVTDGGQAIELFPVEQPDLVITDIYLPGMDGFALTRAVQRLAAPRWQPVIFLSAHRDDALQLSALSVGADAYITKPVTAEMLAARLSVISRLLNTQRQAEERAKELERYYAAEEEEKRMAQHLLNRLVSSPRLADPAVRHWIAPAATFSGDIIVAGRTPGDVLHVLLADGTGHGLAASINVIPIIAPFYRMTEKGFSVEAIVRELNLKVRELLPNDRFVAATIVAVDFRDGIVKAWTGGNPAPIMVSQQGEIERTFSERHPPLGVLDDAEFESEIEVHPFYAAADLILYSDGVTEAESRNGNVFGRDRLIQVLAQAPIGERVEQVKAALLNHLDGHPAHDDISLLAVSCCNTWVQSDFVATDFRHQNSALGNWHFSLRLGATELRTLDVVPVLLGIVSYFEGARDRTGELFVILSELFNNALDHGLLRLDSGTKQGPEGLTAYFDQRASRLASLQEGEIEIELTQFAVAEEAWMSITCRDSGPGFDTTRICRDVPSDSELPFGRGISLVRTIAATLEYNRSGNEAKVRLPLRKVC